MLSPEQLDRAHTAFEKKYCKGILPFKRGGSVFAENVPEDKYVDHRIQEMWEVFLSGFGAALK